MRAIQIGLATGKRVDINFSNCGEWVGEIGSTNRPGGIADQSVRGKINLVPPVAPREGVAMFIILT